MEVKERRHDVKRACDAYGKACFSCLYYMSSSFPFSSNPSQGLVFWACLLVSFPPILSLVLFFSLFSFTSICENKGVRIFVRHWKFLLFYLVEGGFHSPFCSCCCCYCCSLSVSPFLALPSTLLVFSPFLSSFLTLFLILSLVWCLF